MSTIAPPRIELLLESLGAEHAYGEAVIGDLAEEFQVRVERDGERAARAWYHREAVRAVPVLVRNWTRRVRAWDVAQLAFLTLAAFVVSHVIVGGLVNRAYLTMMSTGLLPGLRGMGGELWLIVALKWPLAIANALLVGFGTAWFYARAPLVGAFMVGIVWALFWVGAPIVLWGLEVLPARAALVALVVQLAGTPFLVLGTTLGGIVRVVTLHRSSPR